jgi:hypothetical protein
LGKTRHAVFCSMFMTVLVTPSVKSRLMNASENNCGLYSSPAPPFKP